MSVNVKIIVDYNTLPQEEGEFIKRTVTFIDNLSGIETKIHENIVPKDKPFNNIKTKHLNGFIARSFQLNAIKMTEKDRPSI